MLRAYFRYPVSISRWVIPGQHRLLGCSSLYHQVFSELGVLEVGSRSVVVILCASRSLAADVPAVAELLPDMAREQ